MKRLILMLSTLLVLGAAAAQDQQDQNQQQQNQQQSQQQSQATTPGEFDIERVQPIGVVEVERVAIEGQQEDQQAANEIGAIVLTQSTPGDQHANFDVVGPNGYHEHFDFEDAAGGERVLEDLEPGVYSIAATDENLGLAHTVVEVAAGESTTVHVELSPWVLPAAEEQQAQDQEQQAEGEQVATDVDAVVVNREAAVGVYGRYEGYEDVQPGYPYGAYAVGPYGPYDAAEAGALVVEGMDDAAELVVTGPNGFSDTAENGETVDGLVPGQYVLAATGEGLDLAVTTVQVRLGQILSVDPDLAADDGQGQQNQQNEGQGQDGGGQQN